MEWWREVLVKSGKPKAESGASGWQFVLLMRMFYENGAA
jgi:hypothetical protein